MIKALFFDLDGTLLTPDKRLSDASVSALAACRERGIQVYTATARPPRLARIFGWGTRELPLFDGGVFYNGGSASGMKNATTTSPPTLWQQRCGLSAAFRDSTSPCR